MLPLKTAWQLVGKLLHEKGQKLILLYQCRPVFGLPVPVRLDGAQLFLGAVELGKKTSAFSADDGQLLWLQEGFVEECAREHTKSLDVLAIFAVGAVGAGPFRCPHYQGIQGGIIVKRGDAIVEEEGCFIMPGDTLLGGWAKVYRDDRRYPIVARVSLAEYHTRKSLWQGKPTTMIAKVAKVQALREAFPNQLGAMYTQEETIQDAEYTEVTVAREKADHANKEIVDFNAPEPAPTTPAAPVKPSTPNNNEPLDAGF